MNAKGIDPCKVSFSEHAVKQIRAKGFTAEQLFGALTDPRDVTVVRDYHGQKRWCGSGVALVIDVRRMHVVTVYADMIRTPLREDQLNDPRALASRRALR